MELYLQFGYGMMDHCRQLISKWGKGTVILSPRDLTDAQLRRFAGDITKLPGGAVLLDPQFYLPHADHERLCSHSFWPDEYATNTFWQGTHLQELLSKIFSLNNELGCNAFILPGLLATQIDDDWLETQRTILEEAKAFSQPLPIISTLALGAEAIQDSQQVVRLLDWVEQQNCDAYYLVCEHVRGNYLVDDPNWLANILDIVAGLRMRNARVILGYCNHQMVIAAASKADAICSGTWMNVRSFLPAKFKSTYEEEIKQRATWFYCPQALSEYKIPFLDIAHRFGLLPTLAPSIEVDGGYCSNLFGGAQPTSIGFSEQAAFRHYLYCLSKQASEAVKQTFDETVNAYENLLNSAEVVLRQLSSAGIRGQLRDFGEIIDVNRAALSLHVVTRGPMLRRRWSAF